MVRNSQRRSGEKATVAKWLIIGVILSAMTAVGIGVASKFLFKDEKVAKERMEAFAREYYENYIYENIVSELKNQEDINTIMEKYVVRGFATVYLRQLLLYDGQKNKQEGRILTRHCDENRTSVKFYPEEPFDKKSYRMEFWYDCDF